MAAPTSSIYGTFKDSKGVVLANADISFEPLGTPFTSGGDIVIGGLINSTLDSSGQLGVASAFTLVQGSYRVVVSDRDAFTISVPGDGGSHDIKDLGTDTGNSEVLNALVSSSDIDALIEDTISIETSLKGERYSPRTSIIVFGEGNVLTTQTYLYPQWQSLGASHVICLGDANPGGAAATIDDYIGPVFHNFILNYSGAYGSGAVSTNKFWYVLGDDDWTPGNVTAVTDYFTFPTASSGNERYYKTTMTAYDGSTLDLFVLSSSDSEPDGNTYDSTQGQWLQAALASSTARYKVVAFNHAPFASKTGYSVPEMDWPFAAWGADLVLASGAAFYERILLDDSGDNSVYLVICGTASDDSGAMDSFGTPVSGSEVRVASPGFFTLAWNEYSINAYFIDHLGQVEDNFFIYGADTSMLSLSTKLITQHGIVGTTSGMILDFGTANNQVLSGTDIWSKIQEGRIVRLDALPATSELQTWPYYRNCLFLIGDDPASLYYWNEANESFDLMVTSTVPSVHSGARTQLAVPTFDPEPTAYPPGTDAIQTAAMVEIDHVDTTVEIWYALNGGEFQQFTAWPTTKRIYAATSGLWWIAAFARKAGSIDSEIVIGNYKKQFAN